MVDSLEHQSLLSALHERHTFNDRAVARQARRSLPSQWLATECQAVPVKELIERSRRQHMPSWPMEAVRRSIFFL